MNRIPPRLSPPPSAMLTVLWTDALFMLVLLAMAALLLHIRKHEHFARPWRSVFRRGSTTASWIILLSFLLIALADSIHYRVAGNGTADQGEILSLLDHWLEAQRTHSEKTYSAPLSAYGYAREMVAMPNGQHVFTYPRLKYGGSHLQQLSLIHI